MLDRALPEDRRQAARRLRDPALRVRAAAEQEAVAHGALDQTEVESRGDAQVHLRDPASLAPGAKVRLDLAIDGITQKLHALRHAGATETRGA